MIKVVEGKKKKIFSRNDLNVKRSTKEKLWRKKINMKTISERREAIKDDYSKSENIKIVKDKKEKLERWTKGEKSVKKLIETFEPGRGQ